MIEKINHQLLLHQVNLYHLLLSPPKFQIYHLKEEQHKLQKDTIPQEPSIYYNLNTWSPKKTIQHPDSVYLNILSSQGIQIKRKTHKLEAHFPHHNVRDD